MVKHTISQVSLRPAWNTAFLYRFVTPMNDFLAEATPLKAIKRYDLKNLEF